MFLLEQNTVMHSSPVEEGIQVGMLKNVKNVSCFSECTTDRHSDIKWFKNMYNEHGTNAEGDIKFHAIPVYWSL